MQKSKNIVTLLPDARISLIRGHVFSTRAIGDRVLIWRLLNCSMICRLSVEEQPIESNFIEMRCVSDCSGWHYVEKQLPCHLSVGIAASEKWESGGYFSSNLSLIGRLKTFGEVGRCQSEFLWWNAHARFPGSKELQNLCFARFLSYALCTYFGDTNTNVPRTPFIWCMTCNLPWQILYHTLRKITVPKHLWDFSVP